MYRIAEQEGWEPSTLLHLTVEIDRGSAQDYIQVNSGTLTITPTGNPLPVIPAGVYTMNFLTGVFSLDAGIYDVSANISFPGASVTLNKLLLIRSQVISHFGVSALADLDLVTRLVVNNPNGDANQVRARFFDQTGNPLDVRLNGATTSNTVLEVPGRSSLQSQLEAAGDGTSVGWILLTSESNLTFRSAVIFTDNTPAAATMATSVNGNRLRTEAGISSSELDTRHVLRVTASQDGVNTAFAIANPTEAIEGVKAKSARFRQSPERSGPDWNRSGKSGRITVIRRSTEGRAPWHTHHRCRAKIRLGSDPSRPQFSRANHPPCLGFSDTMSRSTPFWSFCRFVSVPVGAAASVSLLQSSPRACHKDRPSG